MLPAQVIGDPDSIRCVGFVSVKTTTKSLRSWSCGVNSPSRVALQSLHRSSNLFRCLSTDVEKTDELLDGCPTQVTQALIPCIEKGSQNYGPKPEAMCGQGCRVVEPNVHPRGPISASRTGALAEMYFLPRQKANPVGLLSHSQKRLLQRTSGADRS